MNNGDRQRLDVVEQKIDEIKDKYLTDIYKAIGKNSGKIAVIIPLIIMLLALVIGLYFRGG